MSVKFSTIDYSNSKSILFLANQPSVELAVTFLSDSSLAEEQTDGRKIIKAGKVYPANNATAQGVVSEDYDVTDGDVAGSIIIFGFIDKNKLPDVPASNAVAAMKGITLLPFATTIVTGISLDEDTLALADATPTELTATVLGFDVSEVDVTWESSDEDVATVDDGTVTAVGPGTCNIIATADSLNGPVTATCVVTSTHDPE